MANTFTDKLTKLGNRVEQIDYKVAELTNQREATINEIQSLVGGTSQKTITTGKKNAPGSMGQKILSLLQTNDTGQTRNWLAEKMRVAPSRIGVALYHLTNKGLVSQQGDVYYPAATATAKTTEPEQD